MRGGGRDIVVREITQPTSELSRRVRARTHHSVRNQAIPPKTRKHPILRPIHQTMFNRIEPTILQVRSKIRLIQNVMLPISALPHPALLPFDMASAHLSQRNLA